jgi:hypothetical protein
MKLERLVFRGSHKFVDKFFQLEVFIPEILVADLKNHFYELITKSNFLSGTLKAQIKNGVDHKRILFESYIKNYRDVKRFINQIIFEMKPLQDEILMVDFLNFILFKMKFPHMINFLNQNTDILFTRQNDYYELKKKNTEGKDLSQTNILNELSLVAGRRGFYFTPEYYQLYFDFFGSEEQIIYDVYGIYKISDKVLILKTLVHLFGKENNINDSTSIKYSNNFRKLMIQKLSKEDVAVEEFQNLINSEFENIDDVFSNFSLTRIDSLLSHLEYHIPLNQEDFENSLYILFCLWNKTDSNGRSVSIVEGLIFKFFKNHEQFTIVSSSFLTNQIFISDGPVSFEIQLSFLRDLKEYQVIKSNIYKNEQDFYKQFESTLISSFKNLEAKEWTMNNYEFFHVFRSVRGIEHGGNKLLDHIREFLNKVSIDSYLYQLIDNDSWNKNMFHLPKNLDVLFGSNADFLNFVEMSRNIDENNRKEILFFAKLCFIVNQSKMIIYSFTNSEFRARVENSGKDEVKTIQLFFETNDEELVKFLQDKSIVDSVFKYEGLQYVYIEAINAESYVSFLVGLVDKIHNCIIDNNLTDYKSNGEVVKEGDKLLVNKEKNTYLSFYYGASAYTGSTSH